MEQFTFCAPCLFGLEGLVGAEARKLGLSDVRVEDRRVFFTGGADAMAKANLCLRMAERVMILLARFEAKSFEDLYQGVKAIELERFIPRDGQFPVKGYALSSALHSVPDCQSIVKKAAVDRLGAKYGLSWLPETGAVYPLRFSIMKDVCEVFLDTSGVSLHKRGYRAVGNEAPLHETMAAAMVELAKYRGRDFFWDPFCGSGTIVIEAALMAKNRAPGLRRKFGAEAWDCFDASVWQREREAAIAREFSGDYKILGSDIDGATLSIAAANAKKAGVAELIEFRQLDAVKASFPAECGTVACNPPYGERMGEHKEAQALYRALGSHWKGALGWKKCVLSSDPEFEYFFGARADKKRKLYNGRLQCNLYLYEQVRK